VLPPHFQSDEIVHGPKHLVQMLPKRDASVHAGVIREDGFSKPLLDLAPRRQRPFTMGLMESQTHVVEFHPRHVLVQNVVDALRGEREAVSRGDGDDAARGAFGAEVEPTGGEVFDDGADAVADAVLLFADAASDGFGMLRHSDGGGMYGWCGGWGLERNWCGHGN